MGEKAGRSSVLSVPCFATGLLTSPQQLSSCHHILILNPERSKQRLSSEHRPSHIPEQALIQVFLGHSEVFTLVKRASHPAMSSIFSSTLKSSDLNIRSAFQLVFITISFLVQRLTRELENISICWFLFIKAIRSIEALNNLNCKRSPTSDLVGSLWSRLLFSRKCLAPLIEAIKHAAGVDFIVF